MSLYVNVHNSMKCKFSQLLILNRYPCIPIDQTVTEHVARLEIKTHCGARSKARFDYRFTRLPASPSQPIAIVSLGLIIVRLVQVYRFSLCYDPGRPLRMSITLRPQALVSTKSISHQFDNDMTE